MSNDKQPEIRFPGFTGDWEQRKLGDVSNYSNGGSYESDVENRGKYELITLKSVDMFGNLVSSGKFINKKVPTLNKGTLVMILSEQSPGLLGMTAQIPKDDTFVLNQRVAEIHPNDDTNGYFLSMAINRSQAYFSKRGAGTKVQNISKSNVENFEFFIPIKHEQQKIGSFFKQLDKTITLHQRKLDLLKETKKGFLQKMFPKNGAKVPEIRFPGFTEDWEQRKLGDLGSVAMNKRIFKDQTSDNGEVPFFKIGTFGSHPDAFISRELFEEYKSKYPYPEVGDILISASGSIGRTVVYQGEDEYFQDSNIVWLKHNGRLDNKFLQQFYSIVKWQGLEGSTIKRLYNKNILDTNISVPTLDEQNKLGAFFEQLDDTIALQQRKLDLLKETKKGFLQKMFV
ncbi:restriction endonuclease subunit S [Enterococcus faecium]|uniref:restriction endonuclease subunit S n=1 Tax=Enterococcus faecium TaxID=1352 RepID=UPI000CF06983|nr:restriction endonuclease subunit S [Enterococcus faecium]EGP4927284.1 restriction endonuclease subunit S [Enterococcus faecium]EGP5054651.1 restriction endonuclease subunit S [Enterococcus faecium]EGP5718153.1 restriction endonuclease subunit S [Enterococcus faecium]EME3483500.1 restriction endonuclease subunit S [Enterococcus faecium]PQB68972.1 restriction endonuclease subunit S [Enterococcus faecium]